MNGGDEVIRLYHILDHICEIEQMTVGGAEAFGGSLSIRKAVFYDLLVIGEAARAFPETFRIEHKNIPWRQMIAFRNVLAHEYDRVRAEIVWQVIVDDLPALKREVQSLI